MPERNGSPPLTVDAYIHQTLEPLERERRLLVGRAEALRADLDANARDIKRIDGILRAAGMLETSQSKSKSPKRKNQAGQKYDPEKFNHVMQTVIKAKEPLTTAGIAEKSGVPRATVGFYVRGARDRGILRIAGATPPPGGKGREMNLYAATPDALERLEAVTSDGA